jgi:DNA gyrase/topoisomerase IV subunit B
MNQSTKNGSPPAARKAYDARSITVLEGLAPVRLRPGMYIGGTGKEGLHHLLWEIVDNAVDEAMNGFATLITVSLHDDGRTVTVSDNGRGIPVDMHPTAGKSALEVIFTTLHAGAKFDNDNYATAGGLHGVGASVVNALSSYLCATVRLGGKEWRQEFRRGNPRAPVREIGPARGTGTTIQFTPDEAIFGEAGFDAEVVREGLDVKAYLNTGLRIVFKDAAGGLHLDMQHPDGLREYLEAILQASERRAILDAPFLLERSLSSGEVDGRKSLRLSMALQWTESPREEVRSFVNGIPTRDGGTHEQGFRDGVARAVRNFIETHEKQPRGIVITAEDIREGLVALLSVFMPDPQFQGQTKDRLNNPELRGNVENVVRPVLEQWLHENRSAADLVVARIVQAARARLASRQAAQQVRRKSAISHRLNLPGKLADCSTTDPSRSELFIVEGDSAGGSAKQGRDRETQAILPLRGKVLNAEQASLQKVLSNAELSDVVRALGCGIGTDFDASRLRYHSVVLLMDADSDGHHISTLLLTFFFRHLPGLIERGHVYLAQPPLYRIDAGNQTWWAADDAEKARILARLPARVKPEITRFKGLGEMMPRTLYETTLDPRRRRLLRVIVPEDKNQETEQIIEDLLGKDPSARFREIMERAEQVEALDV